MNRLEGAAMNRGLILRRASQLGKVAAGVALSLAGAVACTSVPTRVEIPKVVWPDGEPSGALESNEWVTAAREFDLILAASMNAGDLSDPLLTEITTRSIRSDLYSWALSNASYQPNEMELLSGPTSWAPLEVIVNETKDFAVVRSCVFATPAFSAADPAWEVDRSKAFVRDEAYRRRSNGTIQAENQLANRVAEGLIGYEDGSGAPCDGSEIRVGYFDPLPEVPPKMTRDSLVPPVGVEKK